MKFLSIINRNFLISLTSMLLLITIAGYFIIQVIILNEARESLLELEQVIKVQMSETGKAATIFPIIEIETIDQPTTAAPVFNKIFIWDNNENELEPFLEYSNEIEINGVVYSIKLRQSIFESEDLILLLGITLFLLLLLSFAVSFFVAKKMNKTVWLDFEHNLFKIENFNFTGKSNLQLNESKIEEFDRLNKVISKMTEKLKTDYLSLKEFTENASHEIQTPLTVLMLNLEEILQQNLEEDTFRKVVASINAARRLSNLNQSLILLAKIENRQFVSDTEIALDALIKQKLDEFSSLIEIKALTVDTTIEHSFILTINEHLAEILVSNLLANAINHNIAGGKIEIVVLENKLKICNSGEENNLTNANIFNRFAKGNSRSTGLGLAIVKNICDAYNLWIDYSKKDMHCFTISSKL